MASVLAEARKGERRAKLLRAAVGVAAVGAIGAVIYWVWPEDLEVDPAVQARFEPHMDSYGRDFPVGATELYVAGGLLPIEEYQEGPSDEEIEASRGFGSPLAQSHRAWRVHDLYNSLPDALVATDPSEVGTLARVSCSPVEAGVYVPGEGEESVLAQSADDGSEVGTAYRIRCEIALVDLGAGRQIGQQSFVGGDPPQTAVMLHDLDSDAAGAADVNDRFGSRPRDEMLAFLESLPRR